MLLMCQTCPTSIGWGQVSKYALTDKDCAVSETEFTVRMHNIYWTVNGNANGKGI